MTPPETPDGPTEPRPTKAIVESLRTELEYESRARERVVRDLDAMVTDRDRWREAKAPDLEAEAIAGCVRAIEAVAQAERNTASSQGHYTPGRPGRDVRAHHLPVGRILLHLAARYGVELVEPPPPDRPERRLVSLPSEVAAQLEQLAHRYGQNLGADRG